MPKNNISNVAKLKRLFDGNIYIYLENKSYQCLVDSWYERETKKSRKSFTDSPDRIVDNGTRRRSGRKSLTGQEIVEQPYKPTGNYIYLTKAQQFGRKKVRKAVIGTLDVRKCHSTPRWNTLNRSSKKH